MSLMIYSSKVTEETKILNERMQLEHEELFGVPDLDPDNSMKGAEGLVLARVNHVLVGMTGWGRWENGDAKIRLFYVAPEQRRLGVATALISALEVIWKANGFKYARFESGSLQTGAHKMYLRHGYNLLDYGFGYYKDEPGSKFFGKAL